MKSHLPIRIVGIGSDQGDDVAGWEVVRRLQRELGQTEDLQYHILAGGQKLLELLDCSGTLFVVDAIESNDSAEPYVRLEWPSPSLQRLSPGTTHDMNVAQSLKLAECLGLLPQHVVIWGVPASNLLPADSRSERVEASISKVMGALKQELCRLDFAVSASENCR